MQKLLSGLKYYRRALCWLEGAFILILALSSAAAAAQPPFQPSSWVDPDTLPATGATPFPLPNELVDEVVFWCHVFGVWSRDELILHDENQVGLVYSVSKVPGPMHYAWSAAQGEFAAGQRRLLQKQLRELERAVRVRHELSDEQVQLLRLFNATAGGRDTLFGAADRVRIQQGMRERFQAGLTISGRYRSWFKSIFKNARLPEQLALLPHIESSFQTQAVSPVGAAGVWQFMPETAKSLNLLNDVVDERRDPILAARGAARYFQDAYRLLRDWGLAVTAYNHGVEGMLRARDEFGPNIGKIAKEFRSQTFGFASRNFYPEFLAVLQIDADLEAYFPRGVKLEPPWAGQRVTIPVTALLSELANLYRIDKGQILNLNPAFTEDVVNERRVVPAGLQIWLPRSAAQRAAKLVASRPLARD